MDVFCEICGKQWDMRDPGVNRFTSQWECADESLCFERKAMAALDQQVREG